jgi:hypothetical protein
MPDITRRPLGFYLMTGLALNGKRSSIGPGLSPDAFPGSLVRKGNI